MIRIALMFFVSFICLSNLSAQLSFFTNTAATGSSGQAAAGALNDSWESAQQTSFCGTDLFIPSYGIITDDCSGGAPVGAGSIAGLIISDNITYTGTVSVQERIVKEDDSDLHTFGIPYTSACGSTGGVRDDSDNTMQGQAPSANTIGMIDSDSDGNLDYYNGYASPPNGSKTAILISLSIPVTDFGLFLGDTESRSDGLDGYPAQVLVFSGGTIIDQQDVPTSTANQSNCNGDNNSSFDGCGNDETVWVSYSGSAIDAILLVVGEVISDAAPNNNKASFGGLTLGGVCQATLPSELSLFEIQSSSHTTFLEWTTQSEINSAHFIIQHSLDGLHFQTIGKIESEGDPYTVSYYHYEHLNPGPGDHYYRLKMVDTDGSFIYSAVKSTFIAAEGGLRVYPNPAVNSLKIDLPFEDQSSLQYELFSLRAGLIERKPLPSSNEIDVSRLASGAYFIRIRSAGQTLQQRFIIHK